MAEAAQADTANSGAYILLTGTVEREDNQYVSLCPELEVASCGDTVEEAFAMLTDAIDVYLRGLVEIGTLNEVLREQNVEIEYEALPNGYRPRFSVVPSTGDDGPMYQFYRTALPV